MPRDTVYNDDPRQAADVLSSDSSFLRRIVRKAAARIDAFCENHAPAGYQDDTGFHHGEPVTTSQSNEASAD